MEELNNLLNDKNIHYDLVKKYLNSNDENIYFKLLHNIIKFDDDSKKKLCENIINTTNNENVIDTTCREISAFIPFDYEYYKGILKIILSKKFEGRCISEFKKEILEKSTSVLQEIFQDFALDKPKDIDYDLAILQVFLQEYDECVNHLNKVNITREQILQICKRLNYILTIELNSILKLFFHFHCVFKFTEDELNSFLRKFIFNYPSICKEFIKNDSLDNSLFIEYLKTKVDNYDLENNIKDNINIFTPNYQRLNEYHKYQINQNNEINEKARGMSLFLDFCKSNTILYGNRYGLTVKHKNREDVSIGNMQEFSYSYPLPLEYIIDPVEYMEKVNNLRNLGKEE